MAAYLGYNTIACPVCHSVDIGEDKLAATQEHELVFTCRDCRVQFVPEIDAKNGTVFLAFCGVGRNAAMGRLRPQSLLFPMLQHSKMHLCRARQPGINAPLLYIEKINRHVYLDFIERQGWLFIDFYEAKCPADGGNTKTRCCTCICERCNRHLRTK